MTPSSRFRHWAGLLALTLFVLALFGCASPNSKHSSIMDEEVYIDLKQGFSLVVPSNWQRNRIPVSSPRHRPETVEWRITEANTQIGTFQVTTINPENLRIPPKPTASPDIRSAALAKVEPRDIEHPAGPALRWESKDKFENIIRLSIKGSRLGYIITCNITESEFAQLSPTVEKVILSFSILQNQAP
jgi:hypothetical protein